MSTETEVNIHLTAEDRASALIRKVQREVEALGKSLRSLNTIKVPDLKAALGASDISRRAADDFMSSQRASMAALRQRFAFEGRMQRQQVAEARAADRERQMADAVQLRGIRERMRLIEASFRQQSALERQAAREEASTRQARERADREVQRRQDRAQRDITRRGRQIWDRGRDAIHDTTRPLGATALAGTAAAAAATRRILGAESSIDAAEINARIYGGLSQDAARKLRDQWAAPLAEALGAGTDRMLSSYTDALKLGIPTAGAQAFSELATKVSEAWSVPFETVTDTLGTINSLLTSRGQAFSADRLRSVANTMQHLAAKQSTTPERLISFLQRGAGAADVLGMSQESGLAFGSASTSLGNQAAQSGRLFDYIASRLIELPRLTRQRGQEGQQARDLVRALGYRSADDMDRKRRADPDAFLPEFMGRFNRIKNPKTQDQAIRFFTGREWLGEFGRMVKGIETYKEAQKLAKEAKGLDAIGQVWELHRTKLGFVFQQFSAGFKNILGEFGKVLSPMAREAGDYFLKWTGALRSGGLAARFKAGLEGLIEGLGFRDLKGLLEGAFGRPGEGSAGAVEAWRAFARGFGEGLREVGAAVKAFFSVFTGGDTSPETIGKWTARLLGFSAALVALNPLLGALASVTAFVTSLGTAALALSTAGGAAGLAGAFGAAVLPVSLVAISAGAVAAFWGKDALKGLFLGVPSGDGGKPKTWEGDLGGALGAVGPRRQGSGAISGDSGSDRLGGSEGGDRLHRSSFSAARDTARSLQRLAQAWQGDGARIAQSATVGSPALASLFGFAPRAGGGFDLAPSTGGGSGYGAGLGTESGRAVPQWYKRGGAGGADASGGSATSNPANSAASARMLDAIAGTESGKAGYDAVLGNGRYGTPSKPVSTMTLDEAFAFGRQVRARHGSSSALGRYQIVGNTMRAAQKALGLDGSTVFNAETQDRMARWIARNQGLGAWEGLKHNPTAMARAQAAMAEGGARDVPGGTAATGATGINQYDGLRIKGAQAIAGGAAHRAVTDLMRNIQGTLPGGVKHFAAVNDKYHAGTGSKHALGLAFDTSLLDPSKSREAAEAMRVKLRAAGLGDDAFRVIDEYKNPSARATAGHLHAQFNSREAAEKYLAAIQPRVPETMTGQASEAKAIDFTPSPHAVEIAKVVVGRGTGGTRRSGPGVGAGDLANPNLMGGGRSGPSVGSIVNNVTVNGANRPNAELAGQVQGHVQAAWNFRAHDLEPELT